jgi:hypothetical protein
MGEIRSGNWNLAAHQTVVRCVAEWPLAFIERVSGTTMPVGSLFYVSHRARPKWSWMMSNSQDPDLREANARADRQSESSAGALRPMQADKHSNEDPAVQTPVEGRQGFVGRPVLAVLVGGLVLAGIAWLIVHYATR